MDGEYEYLTRHANGYGSDLCFRLQAAILLRVPYFANYSTTFA